MSVKYNKAHSTLSGRCEYKPYLHRDALHGRGDKHDL